MTQDDTLTIGQNHAARIRDILDRLQKPISLIGMMGAGKTRLGRSLADLLNIPFCDSDAEVELAAGCSIADIFELYGEDAFRDVETRVLARLVETRPQIIACGGGIIVRPENRDILRAKTICLHLHAPVDVLLERTSNNPKRPLLNTVNPKGRIEELLARRDAWYNETSHIHINTDKGGVSKVLTDIITALEAYDANH